MLTMRIIAAVASLTASICAAPAAPPEPPPGAAACSGCHPANPGIETPVPRLAGRNPAEMVQQMQAFRDGQRDATVMGRIAKGFTDPEIQATAAWYAEQR